MELRTVRRDTIAAGRFFLLASRAMCDVTQILGKIESGDPSAAGPPATGLRGTAEIRRREYDPGETGPDVPGHGLVHEAYIRLVDAEQAQQWDSRGHFFAAAAEAMRRILIDRAHDRKPLKRDGCRRRVNLDEIEVALDTPADQLLALNDALDNFCSQYPDCGELVKRGSLRDYHWEMRP